MRNTTRPLIPRSLLTTLVSAGVAADANALTEGELAELSRHHRVLAVHANANGANGALFVVFGRLYALTRRDGRLLQVI